MLCNREVLSMAASLYKVEEKKFTDTLLDWTLQHPKLVFMTLFIVLALLFGLLFHFLYGMVTIESGVMRNYMSNNL